MLYIVGLGPGHRDYIIKKAIDILEKCDYVIGFKRAIDSLDFINCGKIYINKLSDIDEYIKNNHRYDNKNIAIAASGDPTFYGITNYIKEKAEKAFEVIPGISSFQYLTSKIKLPWNNAYLGSLHGRKEDFLDNIKKNELSIWLTDKENTPEKLCNLLYENNINCTVYIGENLSYDHEIIRSGSPKDFLDESFSSLNVFVVKLNY